MTEHITHEPKYADAWVCLCGNRPDLEGFYPCTDAGVQCEPTAWAGWLNNLYECDRCHRIIDGLTLEVVDEKTLAGKEPPCA